jgi:dTDP-L-rhamnose 4-epimerase
LARTCIVTGGAGFIGCSVSGLLVESYDTVIAVDNLHRQVHSAPVRPAALDPGVELVVADITDEGTWHSILERHQPDTILHLAAETGTAQSLDESTRHATVNAVGTARMLDALTARRCQPRRIVLASSRAVYGEGAWKDTVTGELKYPGYRTKAQLERGEWDFAGLTFQPCRAGLTEPCPTSIYGATKLTQEQMLSIWSRYSGASLAVLRLQNVYGPGQSLTNPYTGIIPLFAQMARRKESIPVYEDGAVTRDFVFIEDVSRALHKAATVEIDINQTFDIGSGKSVTLLHLADAIAQAHDAPPPHINGKFRFGDVRNAACDPYEAGRALAWSAVVDLLPGLRRTYDWIKRQLSYQSAERR